MSDDILKNVKGLDTFTLDVISNMLEQQEEKKQEEQDMGFKESYLRNDISFKESYLRNDFDNKS